MAIDISFDGQAGQCPNYCDYSFSLRSRVESDNCNPNTGCPQVFIPPPSDRTESCNQNICCILCRELNGDDCTCDADPEPPARPCLINNFQA